jgi:hypothetical protein
MYDEMTRRTPLRQAANVVEDGELIMAVNIDTDFIGGGWDGMEWNGMKTYTTNSLMCGMYVQLRVLFVCSISATVSRSYSHSFSLQATQHCTVQRCTARQCLHCTTL